MWSWLSPVKGPRSQSRVTPAEPGTEDAERVALAVVLGAQELIDQGVPDKVLESGLGVCAHVTVPDPV
jgi:hypothetical protein